ncbi:MAG: alcohol dehydrogenase catalytic domain-containing protein [Thermomicrobiales bacterium]|nr:alcohol dehydrogenase catalytic domain-containing protein [Thermomicrobiales bacterium]
MLALRWHGREDVRLDEIDPPPPPGPGEVQIDVAWCGICGTDVEEYRAGPIFVPVDEPNPLTGRKAPLTLGHEFSGRVVEIGPGVDALRVGDRVAVDTLIFCGSCYWCQRHQVSLCDRLAALGLMADGGLAEKCNAPAYSCVLAPDTVSDEAAALAETLAVAIRALRRGRLRIGERVVVVGGGAVGQMAVQAALAGGAASVTLVEPMEGRRNLALTSGATSAVTPEDLPPGQADLAVECSGNGAAVAEAVQAVRKGGRVVLVGISGKPIALNPLTLVATEKEMIGSLSHVYDEDFRAAVALLGREAVIGDLIVSDRVPLARALEDGLLALLRNPEDHLKILISPRD